MIRYQPYRVAKFNNETLSIFERAEDVIKIFNQAIPFFESVLICCMTGTNLGQEVSKSYILQYLT